MPLKLRNNEAYRPFRKPRCLGSKVVDFSGWEMPLLYRGIVEDHDCWRYDAFPKEFMIENVQGDPLPANAAAIAPAQRRSNEPTSQ